MVDNLIVVLKSHGFENGELVYYSPHSKVYVVADKGDDHFFVKDIDTGAYIITDTTPTYDGYVARITGDTGSVEIDGLELLAGSVVFVYNDEELIGEYLVNESGVVSFPNPLGNTVSIGTPFTSLARTLRLEINLGIQTSQSNIKRINRIATRVVNTKSFTMKAAEETRICRLPFTNETIDVEENILSGYENRATVEFKSIGAEPLTLLSTVIKLEYKN